MRTTIQFGPQHPVWVEPIRMKLTLSGELVKDAELEVGYVHKGLEKKFEWDYNKGAYLSERVCAICTQHHSTCYCLAVEGTMNLEGAAPSSHHPDHNAGAGDDFTAIF